MIKQKATIKVLFFNLCIWFCLNPVPNSKLLISAEGEGWTQVSTTEHWTVFTRDSKISSVKEVKVEGVMLADFESVKRAMVDIEAYPEWVFSCLDSYKFDILNDSMFHSYTKTDLPFPLKDRDLVVYTYLTNEVAGEWGTTSDARPIKLPELDSAVRIETYHAEWKMKANMDNTVNFIYKLAMHPGGMLPAWIVNMAIDKIPIKTISALEKRSVEIMNEK